MILLCFIIKLIDDGMFDQLDKNNHMKVVPIKLIFINYLHMNTFINFICLHVE